MICDKLQECAEKQFENKTMPGCVNNNRARCIESSDNRSRVKCEEKKKKYILQNTSGCQIISYKMDGGIIVQDKSVPDGTNKCDYMFLINDLKRKAILVELKGVNIAHALRQIQGTLSLYRGFFQSFSHVYGRIVVTSSVPNLKAQPDYVNLVRLMRRNFSGNLKIAEKELVEKDMDL